MENRFEIFVLFIHTNKINLPNVGHYIISLSDKITNFCFYTIFITEINNFLIFLFFKRNNCFFLPI